MIRRHRGRVWGLLALLLVGGAVVAQTIAERNGATDGPGLSSHDAAPGGALGLALWLEDLGYRVARLEESPPGADSVDLIFLLAPLRPLERTEADRLFGWVRRGGVLVYAPSPLTLTTLIGGASGVDLLEGELAFRLGITPGIEDASPSVPFFIAPSATRFSAGTFWSLELADASWVPLVEARGQTLAATRPLGQGRVYVSAAGALFSNEGLAEADNYAFVLNVLRRHPVGLVAFDEYHHHLAETPSLADVARASPWGWALGYAALLSMLFLVWGGRRFGPALVIAPTTPRSAGDYVVALGGLLQRARALGWAQQQYAILARRRLGRMLGVRPDLPAGDLAQLASSRRAVDAETIAEHVAALDGPALDERSLLARVRGMEHVLHDFENREL